MKTVFGIKNCNTVKKVLDYLNEHQIAYEFHDYKKLGVTSSVLENWCNQVSWEVLVNKKGTTWRQLTDEEKAAVKDVASAVALMLAKTSVIKRPIITESDRILTIGFDEQALAQLK